MAEIQLLGVLIRRCHTLCRVNGMVFIGHVIVQMYMHACTECVQYMCKINVRCIYTHTHIWLT